MNRKPNFRIIALQLLVLIAFLVGWEALSKSGLFSRVLLPSPSSVFQASIKVLTISSSVPGGFYSNLQVYLTEIAVSFLIVVSVGIMVGIVVGVYRLMGELMEPLFLGIYAIPHIIFYPLFILSLGPGISSKVAYGLLSGLTVTIVSVLAYVRQLDPTLAKAAKMMGASLRQMILRVIIPALIPGFEAALQIGLAFTIIGVTTAEILASSQGLGYLMNWSTFLFKSDILFFVIIFVILLSLVINSAYSLVLGFLKRR